MKTAAGNLCVRAKAPHQMTSPFQSGGDPMKTTISNEIIPARGYWVSVVPHGQILRIVDIEGNQGVDFCKYEVGYTSSAPPSPLPPEWGVGGGDLFRSYKIILQSYSLTIDLTI